MSFNSQNRVVFSWRTGQLYSCGRRMEPNAVIYVLEVRFISFGKETICDALAQSGWIKFLSKFCSLPQMHAACQHQIPCMPVTHPLSLPPPPPHQEMELWDFSIFGLSIKSWKLVIISPPPPQEMELWDFSIFGLSIKSWKLVIISPPPKW